MEIGEYILWRLKPCQEPKKTAVSGLLTLISSSIDRLGLGVQIAYEP